MVQNRFFLSFPVKKVNNNKFSSQNFVISSKMTYRTTWTSFWSVKRTPNIWTKFTASGHSARCDEWGSTQRRNFEQQWTLLHTLWIKHGEVEELYHAIFLWKYGCFNLTYLCVLQLYELKKWGESSMARANLNKRKKSLDKYHRSIKVHT